tara:strand:- start:985 stop:1269 length:285 start_codon:yes stop_codon:yes gene_type:complete
MIKTLVMINGAEIIGRLVKTDENNIIVYKPRLVQATQQGVGLVNGICMTGKEVDGEFNFPKHSVAYMVDTMKELADGWTKQTSGIEVAPKGIIL